jgi:hypothetical protein
MRYLKTILEYNTSDVLYHGTSFDNAKSIIDNGITEDIYLGDMSTAETYAYSFNEPVLIQFDLNSVSNYLEPNFTLYNYYLDNIEEDEDYEDIIKDWENSNKNWEDSLEIFGSVILPVSNTHINLDDITYL